MQRPASTSTQPLHVSIHYTPIYIILNKCLRWCVHEVFPHAGTRRWARCTSSTRKGACVRARGVRARAVCKRGVCLCVCEGARENVRACVRACVRRPSRIADSDGCSVRVDPRLSHAFVAAAVGFASGRCCRRCHFRRRAFVRRRRQCAIAQIGETR